MAEMLEEKWPKGVMASIAFFFVLILMLVFRSVVVPIKATAGFLLSILATFGATTAVFQWGWLSSLFGFDTGGPLILDRGASYLQQTMTGVDAQTLESRRLQIEEVCRPFRVMPIMVGHADKTATYASAEQMFLAHVVHTLAPWCERIEQSIDNDLLRGEQGLYAKFNLNGLMRGAFADRMNGYSKALGAGGSPAWMTPNEVRGLEELNPVDGGDELPKPTNPPVPDDPPKPPPRKGDA